MVDALVRRAPSKDEQLGPLLSESSCGLGAESIWRNAGDQDCLALDWWRIMPRDLVRGRMESKFGRNGHAGWGFASEL